MWQFVSEISEGDVADNGMLGLKRDWFNSDNRENIGHVLQPMKEGLVRVIRLVRYIYIWVSQWTILNPFICSPGSTIIKVYRRSSVWKTSLWSLGVSMVLLPFRKAVTSRSSKKANLFR